MELLKDTYIPVVNNIPGDYREWRKDDDPAAVRPPITNNFIKTHTK